MQIIYRSFWGWALTMSRITPSWFGFEIEALGTHTTGIKLIEIVKGLDIETSFGLLAEADQRDFA